MLSRRILCAPWVVLCLAGAALCYFLRRLEAQLEVLGQQGQVKPPRKDQRDMARVNRLNKARNFQNAFQNVGARPEGARTADDGVDPFSRRKTRLVNYWTTNKQKGANAGQSMTFPKERALLS